MHGVSVIPTEWILPLALRVVVGEIENLYCAIKTIADCFKFRNKMGMDTTLEALKLYKARKKFNLEKLTQYARICRVEKVMQPYLEAII